MNVALVAGEQMPENVENPFNVYVARAAEIEQAFDGLRAECPKLWAPAQFSYGSGLFIGNSVVLRGPVEGREDTVREVTAFVYQKGKHGLYRVRMDPAPTEDGDNAWSWNVIDGRGRAFDAPTLPSEYSVLRPLIAKCFVVPPPRNSRWRQ